MQIYFLITVITTRFCKPD